jgi:hypothetical protein
VEFNAKLGGTGSKPSGSIPHTQGICFSLFNTLLKDPVLTVDTVQLMQVCKGARFLMQPVFRPVDCFRSRYILGVNLKL